MEDKKFDELISKGLKNETDAAAALKDQVWKNIEQKILEHDVQEFKASREQGVTRMSTYSRKKKKKGKGRVAAAVVAAGIIIVSVVTFNTETGQAFISQIRQMFEPEKQIVEQIEGMDENTGTKLHENESPDVLEADYIIYVDEERYTASKKDGVHRIEAMIEGDIYPDVYMEITQDVERKPDEIVEELRHQLLEEFPTVTEIEQVTDPVQGYQVRALAGQEWNSEVIVYYVASNELEGSFIFKQAYFLEASEGHGVRMNNMLKEFQIVKPE